MPPDQLDVTGKTEDQEGGALHKIVAVDIALDDHPNLLDPSKNLDGMLLDSDEDTDSSEDGEDDTDGSEDDEEESDGSEGDEEESDGSEGDEEESDGSEGDEDTDSSEDPEEEIRYMREKVGRTPPGHPKLVRRLYTLGELLFDSKSKSNTEALDEAISNMRRATDIAPHGSPALANTLGFLGYMFAVRYIDKGKTEDLEEAVQITQRAVDTNMPSQGKGKERLHLALAKIGLIFSNRFKKTNKRKDVEEAIPYYRQAADIAALQGDKRQVWWLRNLGTLCADLYDKTGKSRDLDESIYNLRRAVVITPAKDSQLAIIMANLGIRLASRYALTGRTEDLEEGIRYARRAIESTPDNHPELGHRLSQLSSVLQYRTHRISKDQDLDENIRIAQRALDATTGDNTKLPDRLGTLGYFFEDRYNAKGKTQDLEEALHYARRAAETTPQNDPHLYLRHHLLGRLLYKQFEDARNIKDLEEAISNAQKAIDASPREYSGRCMMLCSLGEMLASRHGLTANTKDLKDASKHFLSAYKRKNALPSHRVWAARKSIKTFVRLNNLDEASSVARKAVKLIPIMCSRHLSREDQQYTATQTSGLATEACSLLIKDDNEPISALEFLEQGRGLIIGYLLDDRGDISELKELYPEKVEEFERLKYRASMPVDEEESANIGQKLLREREAAEKDLEKCLDDIRKLENHERFLLPPTSKEFKACAADGPIVVVNVTEISSDAIIVSTSKIECIRLPDLGGKKMEQYHPMNMTRCAVRDAKVVGKPKNDTKFPEFLKWLWSACVRLVLEKLGIFKTVTPDGADLPRIWWIGTGLASTLPFHAAGDHSVGSVENTLSWVISSYTPTIRTLLHVRQKAKVDVDKHQDSILLVKMSKTAGANDLPGVEAEARAISKTIRNQHPIHRLSQPSGDAVMQKLKDYGIVHFACHGFSDLANPSNSFLALQGKSKSDPDKLTVQMISNASLGHVWLAYLSACSTAENSVEGLVDEALHLGSSFQVAGFKHVVASMWPSNDAICVEVATLFYSELLTKGGVKGGNKAIAAALHTSVLEVRSRNREQPQLWAQYIHFGP